MVSQAFRVLKSMDVSARVYRCQIVPWWVTAGVDIIARVVLAWFAHICCAVAQCLMMDCSGSRPYEPGVVAGRLSGGVCCIITHISSHLTSSIIQ